MIGAKRKQCGWEVYLNGDLIDKVFYDLSCTKDYIVKSLIEHDGYDSGIDIRSSDRYFTNLYTKKQLQQVLESYKQNGVAIPEIPKKGEVAKFNFSDAFSLNRCEIRYAGKKSDWGKGEWLYELVLYYSDSDDVE